MNRHVPQDDSGNLTSRSDGTHTTTYQWDEDNRLTLVTLPSSATVAYTYDVAGRMLTRTDSTGTTYFTWDGWNMVAELAPNGTQTRYYAPNGELLYFELETATTDQPAVYGSAYYGRNYYGPLVYQVVSDGLGSVRRIVDAYNNVVSTLDFDAYGNLLPSTSDPLNFPYRYVGAFGVRWDSETGLYYARNRWYDPVLQRFVSRDILGANNRYQYCSDNPTSYIDNSGLQPVSPTLPPPPRPGVTHIDTPSDAIYFKSGWSGPEGTHGVIFAAPPSEDFEKIYREGCTCGKNRTSVGEDFGEWQAVGAFGKYDVQRQGTPPGRYSLAHGDPANPFSEGSFYFIDSYRNAGNYNVGIFLNGAGYSEQGAVDEAHYYQKKMGTVNPNDPTTDLWIRCGWEAADPHYLPGPAAHHWAKKVPKP